MVTLTQRELRNDSAQIMDRLEADESFTITRRGRPVGTLVPLSGPREAVPTDELIAAFADFPRLATPDSEPMATTSSMIVETALSEPQSHESYPHDTRVIIDMMKARSTIGLPQSSLVSAITLAELSYGIAVSTDPCDVCSFVTIQLPLSSGQAGTESKRAKGPRLCHS
jgi:prevent-host-death family protein